MADSRPSRRLVVAALAFLVVVGAFVASRGLWGSGAAEKRALPEAAVDGLHFTDVSEQAGLTEVQSPEELVSGETMSSGVAVADVDGDGFDDIFLTRAGLPNILYINQGDGTFVDRTEEANLARETPTYGSSAAVFFDADGDGSLDLFTTGFGRGESHLYMNNGDATFTEDTISRGIVLPRLPGDVTNSQMHGVTVGDANGDGALDLLILHWYVDGLTSEIAVAMDGDAGEEQSDPASMGACDLHDLVSSGEGRRDQPNQGDAKPSGSRSRLFINDGRGNFTDQTAAMGLDFEQVLAFTGVFQDFDGDGWQDLAVTGDGCTSRLFRNIEGTHFEDVTQASGMGTDENGMGIVFKDLNGDGLADVLISSIAFGDADEACIVGGSLVGCSGNRAYINNGDGTFADRTTKLGLRDGGWGWGVAVEDFANSGSLQVAMTNGYSNVPVKELKKASHTDPYVRFMRRHSQDVTRFWAAGADGVFSDVAEAVGITDNGISHGLVPFDYDNDGDLDLLIAPAGERPVLYRNDLPRRNSWLAIRLSDPVNPLNGWGDGARVEVFADGDSKPRTGWITTAGSYESQKPAEFHLGFGERDKPVDRVEVYWPGEKQPQVLRNVKLGQRLVVTRGE